MPISQMSPRPEVSRTIATRQAQLALEPLGAPMGAIVRGLTFSGGTSPETVAEVEAAIGQYQVLVFRGHQPPTDAELAEFTGRFGVRNVKSDDKSQFLRPGFPEIQLISNVIENGKPIGSGANRSLNWHSDLAWTDHNVRFGFLEALEVPARGGETMFANGYAALEALSGEARTRIATLEIYHRHGKLKYPQRGCEPGPGEVYPMKRPVVVTNPASGRKALFMSQLVGSLSDRPVDINRLGEVEELMAHLTSQRFIYEHRWQVGDLVMWDQIGTLHARRELPPERRILRQVTVKVPYPEESLFGPAA